MWNVKIPENPIEKLIDHPVVPENLKEKFLYMTFEIIADKGADGLSASELIRRTNSSKGALFHHFETIDHLCIESLNYFRQHISKGLKTDSCQNLDEYLKYIVGECMKKQSTTYYIHIVHFFRDRAIRDERYRAPFWELFMMQIRFIADRALNFLPPGKDRDQVINKIAFLFFTIEKISFQRVLIQNQNLFEDELKNLIQSTASQLNAL